MVKPAEAVGVKILFARTWNIPNLSHFCCKLETYLRLTEILYEMVKCMPPEAPKGKLPFTEDGDKKLPIVI